MWPAGIPPIFQRSMTVPLHSPNNRHLMPAVRAVQGGCERVYQTTGHLPCVLSHTVPQGQTMTQKFTRTVSTWLDLSLNVCITVMLHEHHGVLNHWQFNWLFNRLLVLTSIMKPILCITGPLCEGNPSHCWIPLTNGFPSQRASNVFQCHGAIIDFLTLLTTRNEKDPRNHAMGLWYKCQNNLPESEPIFHICSWIDKINMPQLQNTFKSRHVSN